MTESLTYWCDKSIDHSLGEVEVGSRSTVIFALAFHVAKMMDFS